MITVVYLKNNPDVVAPGTPADSFFTLLNSRESGFGLTMFIGLFILCVVVAVGKHRSWEFVGREEDE